MQTSAACLPCFRRQIDHVLSQCGCPPDRAEEIRRAAGKLVDGFDRHRSPPENAVELYGLIARLSGKPDPFAALKRESNRRAMALLPRLRQLSAAGPDPLWTAARMSIAGNVIDYGAQQDFDLERTIADCLAQPPVLDNFAAFRKALAMAERILYLADNCGELAFDRLFIERLGKPVTLVVKRFPIINDALAEDAVFCGLDRLCRIIDNGTGCPGTPLDSCSAEFRREFQAADLIISKGQGNFETLSETGAPVFFLFLVKCQVVADHASLRAGRPAGTLRIGDAVIL